MRAVSRRFSDGAPIIRKQTEFDAVELVADTLSALPDSPTREQCDYFERLLSAAPQYQRSVDWYFFTNISSYLKKSGRRDAPQVAPAQKAELAERREAVIAKAVETVKAQLSLLHLTMPNGKAMRYCSGVEMAKFGVGYAKIAKKVGTRHVGEVLSEDEVRALMK